MNPRDPVNPINFMNHKNPMRPQLALARVETMPNLPAPYLMRDWLKVAREYDALIFNHTATGVFQPFIWIDRGKRNSSQKGFGLPTIMGDPRMSAKENPEGHEAINCMAAVLSGALVGIDKTNQDGFDYVRMCENYFNKANGQRVFLNSTGGSPSSFWYTTYPNILFFCLTDLFPKHHRNESLMKRVADQFHRASHTLGKPDWYTGYNFLTHRPKSNGQWVEGDAAAGIGWLQYMAFIRFHDPKYLEGAERAMSFLERETRNPFYEVLLPYGAYLAARMNAETGKKYDVEKILNWCFDDSSACRPGWGIALGKWGKYEVNGLRGDLTDGGGYVFAMNSFHMIGALVPLVRYDPRFARAIGKWVLNAANAARLFYADGLPENLQTCFHQSASTKNVIAYEGLRREGIRPEDRRKIPCACGDPTAGRWGKTLPSDFSLYGSSHAGFLGGILMKTNDEMILQIDCLKTDFFHSPAYPTYLFFNPYKVKKKIILTGVQSPVDLYDSVKGEFLKCNPGDPFSFFLEGNAAAVIVLAPSGGKLEKRSGKLLVNGIVIDFWTLQK